MAALDAENLLNVAVAEEGGSSGAKFELADDKRKENVAKSQLFVKLSKNQWPLVFHPIYDISFCGLEKIHPFDAGKWGKIYKYLKEANMVSDATIVQPQEAQESDLKVVHTERYLHSLKWSAKVASIMEVPCVAIVPNSLVNRYALRPFRFHTGGTILAAKLAIERKWAINLGGGFHHCSSDRGGGFCAYADITLAIEFLFIKNLITRAMIVDLDAHQGNGHERDFKDVEKVFIFDMYNSHIYPGDEKAKHGISRSVCLRHNTKSTKYLKELRENLPEVIEEFRPNFILYNAGTDCLENDPLGNLDISPEGIIKRDEIVFSEARHRDIPIVMVTSGGYQRNNARLIADSILNLKQKGLIHGPID